MLRLVVSVEAAVVSWLARLDDDERAQSTAEYALVVLGAAAIALLVVAWATKTDRIGKLLNGVFDKLLSQVT